MIPWLQFVLRCALLESTPYVFAFHSKLTNNSNKYSRATQDLKQTAIRLLNQSPARERIMSFEKVLKLISIQLKQDQHQLTYVVQDNLLPPYCSRCKMDCFIGYFDLPSKIPLHCETCALADKETNKLNRDYRVTLLVDRKILSNVFKLVR